MPTKTEAMTFDDGPDPIWTPKILAILRREHVPATFFLVGAHVASNPSLVRAELAGGDEVGSHTYTHANLASAGWRLPLELTLTQNALAGAAGIRTRLLRPPYSSVPDALHKADWLAYRHAAQFGDLVVLTSTDTKDWARPRARHIVASAMLILRILALRSCARRHRRRMKPQRVPRNWRPPGISVVMPAFNEAAGIAATVRSMVASNYPGELEVIVVDDGSTDDTAGIVRRMRRPGGRVIREAHAGQPAALTRGSAACCCR